MVKLVEFLHTLVGFSINGLVLTLVEFLHTLVGFSITGSLGSFCQKVFG